MQRYREKFQGMKKINESVLAIEICAGKAEENEAICNLEEDIIQFGRSRRHQVFFTVAVSLKYSGTVFVF